MYYKFPGNVFEFALIYLCVLTSTNAAMTTSGKFAVNNAGAATFSVDIQVPPGTAGMVPKLSIEYNSDGGNGLVGLGGSIGGMSAITRCGRTKAQDNAIGGINLDANDRFCLDGQRLIATKGVDGADGTEYRTEINIYSRIKSYGGAGNGPAWFSVETKAGDTLEYGNTGDSRIEAQGQASVAVWALNKRRDVNSNYLTVTYYEDSVHGAYWPVEIDYTGNANKGIATYNAVKFSYLPRTDTVVSYMAGSLRKESVILQSITTYAGAAAVKSYTVSYNFNATTQRPLMKSIQECAGSGACLPAISMKSAPPAPNVFGGESPMVGSLPADISLEDRGTILVDVNGDGLLDVLRLDLPSSLSLSTQKDVYLNNGTSFVRDSGYSDSLGPIDGYLSNNFHDMGVRVVDVNGDGLPDIIQLYQRAQHQPAIKRVFLNTGSGFALDSTYTASLAAVGFYIGSEGDSDTGGRDGQITATQLVDVNGDGLLDLVSYSSGDQGVFLNTGTSFAYNAAYSTSLAAFSPLMGFSTGGIQLSDLNGDGLPDLLVMSTTAFDAYGGHPQQSYRAAALNTGTSFVTDNNYTNSVRALDTYFVDDFGDTGTRLIDINGDGLPDLVQMYTPGPGQYGGVKQRRAYLNTGRGFVYSDAVSRGLPDVSFSDYNSLAEDQIGMVHIDLGLRFADINGDGLVDLIQMSTNGNTGVWLNNGAGFTASPTIKSSLPGPVSIQDVWISYPGLFVDGGVRFTDMNGDGLPDIVNLNRDRMIYLNQHNMVADRLAEFTQLGATTSVTYGSLTNKSVYTKDTGASHAVLSSVDEQYAKYVVVSAAIPNDNGGTASTTYAYGGLKTDRNGRGGLGFRWIDANQPYSGLISHTEFSQTWPYVGMATAVSERSLENGAQVHAISNEYRCVDHVTGGVCAVQPLSVYFPYAWRTVDSRWDLNGTVMPATTTIQYVDMWGSPTNVARTTSGGFGTTTFNTYMNDTANWFIGRLTNSTVTATIP